MEDITLWTPSDLLLSNVPAFLQKVNSRHSLYLTTYAQLYAWSVAHIEDFWSLIFEHANFPYSGTITSIVTDAKTMWPVPIWFEGIAFNFAEALLQNTSNDPAILFQLEGLAQPTLTFKQLRNQVAYMADWFKREGLQPGDVVAGFVSNCPEAIVAMLAAASLGAIWTSCSPDSGFQFVYDRFAQTEPKFIVAVDAYYYDSKWVDIESKCHALKIRIPSVQKLLLIQRKESLENVDRTVVFLSIIDPQKPVPELHFTRLPFSQPLYILYSSGTTGKPKCIVHGAGGVLLQHIKEHQLQCNLKPGDRLCYYTTTSWMMWNWLVSALASAVSIVLFEGKPEALLMWKLVKDLKMAAYGTSAPWISMSSKSGISFPEGHFPDLKLILSTGGPLLREHFDYVYSQVKNDVQLSSISGGTDIVSCFAGGGPVPVIRGHLQCLGLGMKVDVWDEAGHPVRNKEGELVCTAPFPCMPLYFLNDHGQEKYHAAYFEKFEGIWAHGDFAILYPDLSLEILGRSDSTIKRKGVRIGTSDIYNVLEHLPEIEDSLAVGRKNKDTEDIVLFVQLKAPADEATLRKKIRNALIAHSPFLKPDQIVFVTEIPYTANGKKSEILVKNILNGRQVTNKEVLKNPDCLHAYIAFSKL